MSSETAGVERIVCHKCRHYLITWEPRRPYGCSAHGFKSSRNPSLAVYEASGIPCQFFTLKKGRVPE